ncbi:tail fiber assembly protein [Yersinia hibernica]|uniref:Tail fiber assembly protein n=2 Tax=Yersinia TaxID=629 RepID=A0ABX5QZN1_9GAMM|nr:hypothetical protein D5F51_07415 [Yersinia hibernica]
MRGKSNLATGNACYRSSKIALPSNLASSERAYCAQTDLMLGIIDDAGTARLINLKGYVISLKQLDISTAPEIEWPVAPVS